VETVCPQGAAIGIFDGEVLKSKLKKEVLKINKGDKFLFFTDGIIDAKSNDGKRFGLEKLKEFFMLNAEDTGDILLKKINKEVNYFSEGTIQTDDIAMIILERKKF
jgi:sigma-B regulation protein RsbU (phosphoserine phosphatase)